MQFGAQSHKLLPIRLGLVALALDQARQQQFYLTVGLLHQQIPSLKLVTHLPAGAMDRQYLQQVRDTQQLEG
jgi:hypothetical protein